MATRELGLERKRRHRRLTGLLVAGALITALPIGVSYWGSVRRRTRSTPPPPSPAANVHQQVSGYTFTRNDKGHPVFTIHAARTVSYQQQRTVLEDVSVEVFGRKGDRADIIRTHRCDYDPVSGDFLAGGTVEIELSAHASSLPGSGVEGKRRISLETSKVAYHQKDALADTEAPVKFSAGAATGTAIGLTYATREGWLELKRAVEVDLPRANGEPPLHLTAARLRYDKVAGHVDLAGPVKVNRGQSMLASDQVVLTLDERNRLSHVDFLGHAEALAIDPLRRTALKADRMEGQLDPESGQLRHLTAEQNVAGETKSDRSTSRLTADRVDLEVVGKNSRPLRGRAQGNVQVALESKTAASTLPVAAGAIQGPVKSEGKKVLSAAEVRFEFRPESRSLQLAETVGPGTVVLTPADNKAGEKLIRAGQLSMDFDTRGRIELLRGAPPTEVLFRPPPKAPAGSRFQQSRGDHLEAKFDASQDLHEVRQWGDFQYQDGDRQARADEARYDAQRQTARLFGHPELWDSSTRVKCQTMAFDMASGTFIGNGKVQAVHLPSPSAGTTAAPSATAPAPSPANAPSSGLPINVLADQVIARRQNQTIHYDGHVRAWHGTDVVETSSLDVFRREKRLRSGYQVVTSYLQPASPAGGPGAPSRGSAPHLATVHADFLDYSEQGKQASYRGNVRLVTEGTTLRSDRLDVQLAQANAGQSSQLEHAQADGHVTVTQPGRLGSGDHAEYFAAEGKMIMTGQPAKIQDVEKGSTMGRRLTFFVHDDTVFVDEGGPSPTASGPRVTP